MKNISKRTLAMGLSAAIAMSTLAGCASTGEMDRADVYQAGQLNQAQQTTVVKIIAISPAKVAVDNKQGKQEAQVAGAIIGALLGGAIGHNTSGYSTGGTLAGGAIGGVAGVAAGSMAPGKVLVDGVTLTYSVNGTGRVFSSTQVGHACEFLAGRNAIMISTDQNSTRIQPNGGVCVDPKTKQASN